MSMKTDRSTADRLDQQDPLRAFRARFVIPEPDLIYLDGNSLGRLPAAVMPRLQSLVEEEWGRGLIRSWNQGWWESPRRVGERIAGLVGAAPGQVRVSDSTSVNLFKLATAALRLRPGRAKIVTDQANFPSDLYILQGIADLLSPPPGGAGRPHHIHRVASGADGITPDLDALAAAIDHETALVTLSHVAFKSGYLYDMAAVTRQAHAAGALVLWDLSHSVGAVPIALDACGVDFAVGCTYKYLNGGPGSPAFFYVSKDLQTQAVSPLWGWWGQDDPFAFSLDYSPAAGADRFLCGAQPILSLLAMEASLDLLHEAGMDALRAKSLQLTEYFIDLSDAVLAPLGFTLGSPRRTAERGSHVSLRHPEGYRINRALIEEMKVIPDFRSPDNIRFGFTPLYTSFAEVWQAVEALRLVTVEKRYAKYPHERLAVT